MGYPEQKQESYTNLGGMNTKASRYITPEGQAIRLVNFDSTKPGAWTKVPGTTQYIGATVSGSVGGVFQFSRLSGASFLIVAANTNLYNVDGAFNPIRSSLKDGALFDFVPFVDRLFCANGQDFFKTDGTASSRYSLPPGATGLSVAAGASGGFTGFFQYAYGYLNDRGYFGPVGNFVGFSVATNFPVLTGFTTPSDYGITSLVIYRSENNQSANVFRIGTVAAGSATFLDLGFTLQTAINPPYIWFTLAPRFIELFANSLFMGGFSSLQSTVAYSAIGEPEGVGATASFEVRTNDGDRLTGFKTFLGQMLIGKTKSFHALSGDNPQNYTLKEISDQYGCLSNRAFAVFLDRCHFLDSKGVVEYNGANVQIASTAMEDVFLRMNVEAAVDNAAMLHVKERNEVWTLIPVDGATLNNQLVVFDYNSNSWYERRGLDIRSLALVRTDLPYAYPFYGGYTGNLFKFGPTFAGDNGVGMTCLVLTRFHPGFGHSTESMFRRLWLDVDPQPPSVGGTVVIGIKFYANQGLSSPVLERTIYGSTWQSRIDFGVPGRDIAFEFSHFSETQALRINGYTIAHRFQRNV
jgi:hypothetical protein